MYIPFAFRHTTFVKKRYMGNIRVRSVKSTHDNYCGSTFIYLVFTAVLWVSPTGSNFNPYIIIFISETFLGHLHYLLFPLHIYNSFLPFSIIEKVFIWKFFVMVSSPLPISLLLDIPSAFLSLPPRSSPPPSSLRL